MLVLAAAGDAIIHSDEARQALCGKPTLPSADLRCAQMTACRGGRRAVAQVWGEGVGSTSLVEESHTVHVN